MADDQDPEAATSSKKDKAFLLFGMFWIRNQLSLIIIKYGLGFFERNSMLSLVGSILLRIPNKTNIAHVIII